MSRPSTRTVPSERLTIPQTMLISVVFPAPLGPSKAKISPRRMSRLTPLSAWKPDAYVLERFDMEMIGGMDATIAEVDDFRIWEAERLDNHAKARGRALLRRSRRLGIWPGSDHPARRPVRGPWAVRLDRRFGRAPLFGNPKGRRGNPHQNATQWVGPTLRGG